MVAQLVKNPPAGDPNSIPGWGTSSGEGRIPTPVFLGFPGGHICLQGICGRPGVHPWVGKIPCRRERLPDPGFWPGEFPGQRSLVDSMGSSPWGRQGSDTTERPSHGLAGALVFSQFSAQPLESRRVCETSSVGPPLSDALALSTLRGETPPAPRGLPHRTAAGQWPPCALCCGHTHLDTGHPGEDRRRCHHLRVTVVTHETREGKKLALGHTAGRQLTCGVDHGVPRPRPPMEHRACPPMAPPRGRPPEEGDFGGARGCWRHTRQFAGARPTAPGFL